MSQGFWTDIHAHFDMLEASPGEVIESARRLGVRRIINISTNQADIQKVSELSEKYFPQVCCSLGIHPHDAADWSEEIKAWIQVEATKEHVVSLGEMGLDYYYQNSEPEVQKKAFKEQLELALKLDLPVQIHTRDAEEDTIAILKSVASEFRGVIHCFTGTEYLAKEALALGLDISISGILTFKSAKDLREVVEGVPLNRLHVETDSPFLAPVPERGKKNQPAYVVHTAQFLAKLKNLPLENLCEQVRRNNERVFRKLPPMPHS